MTAVLDAARLVALGWCPACHAAGQAVPVAAGRRRCVAHLVDERLVVETTRSGQARLEVPRPRPRPVYPTGLQVACVPCAAAGVDRLGMPREGAGSDPLCVPCWRGRADRRDAGGRRQLVAELRERLDDVDAGCAVCGELEPVPECWLCGWSHLAEARAAQDRADAADAARVAAEFDRLAEVTAAEGRVDELAAWVDRLRAVLDGYPVGSSRSRAVRLLADLLARHAAARSTTRGRPGALARVAGVLAVDADWRSGRRAMPGRARSADLAGCTERAVTSAWSRATGLGWATLTESGRRLSLAERIETGRCQDRACYDLAPVHLGDSAAQAAQVPAALAVLTDLLEHAAALLAEAQEHLDGLRARAGSWTERRDAERRAQLRAAVAASVTQARDLARLATGQPIDTGNLFPPRMAYLGEYLSSCSYRGLLFSPSITFRSVGGAVRPSRRQDSASRSSTEGVLGLRGEGCGVPGGWRPRPRQGQRERSRAFRPRPEWTEWAYPLARALRQRWTWLAEVPLPRVAATLGAALGRDWTARALIAWTRRARSQPLLTDPRNPAAYLRAVLDEVLTGPVAPPHPAARHTTHRRRVVATEADALRAAQEAARSAQDARGATAVPGHANAAVRALRQRWAATALSECEWPEVAQPGSGTA